MVKKPLAAALEAAPAPEWDPSLKEPWHLEFEEEPVNDDRWNCMVTAAIPAEAGDDECIQSYMQCVNMGLRKTVKIISMADVVKLLKGTNSVTNIQKAKPDKTKTEKLERMENTATDFNPFAHGSNQILGLAANYATISDVECKLPPDLMAAVIKYMILTLKDESCLRKRVEAAVARKRRERLLKAKFIRSLKPYEISQEERKPVREIPPNILDIEEPINDDPLNGPDLYILLTDIYDLFCFPELIRLKVPFVALVKVSVHQEKELWRGSLTFGASRADANSRKAIALSEFWKKLCENCVSLKSTKKFKDIVMMQYKSPHGKNPDFIKHYLLRIFDEMTWMQHSVYKIYRQHQAYLRDLYVQRLILSLEPLDLEKCEVYNKICDVLVSGQPLTPALVLYAMIEQVVAGVPETESVAIEYEPEWKTSFASEFRSNTPGNECSKHPNDKTPELTTPCSECRHKIWKNICEKHKNVPTLSVMDRRSDGKEISEENSVLPSESEECSLNTTSEPPRLEELQISEILRDILADRKAEKEERKDKKWKAPDLCFHGDDVFLQMYHCDPRLLTAESLVTRFLRPTEVARIWAKHPELPPQDRAFYNFHFSTLKKISKESEESLKLKIYFTSVMKLLGTVKSYFYRGDETVLSEMVFFSGNDTIKAPKVTFRQKMKDDNFSNNFFKPYIARKSFKSIHIQNSVERGPSRTSVLSIVNPSSLRKALGTFTMNLTPQSTSGFLIPWFSRHAGTGEVSSFLDESYQIRALSNLLDLTEVSNLIESHFLNNKDDYSHLIRSFKYYEKLESNVMIQRLLDAEEKYNTMQYLYVTPTDTIVIVMINDFDYRGVYYTDCCGVLPTPVSLRDFQNFVYHNIPDWLLEEEETYNQFVTNLEEERKADEDKRDEEYLTLLKREYCEMSPEKRAEFLETVVDFDSEPEVTEAELKDLPIKRMLTSTRKPFFVTTNFDDVRVETKRKINEFYSQDGTEVNVVTDTWLYEAATLLTLLIKRSTLRLYYHQWLNDENVNTAFTFKTTSDIIFAFYKDGTGEAENLSYNVNISWPTGLMVRPVYSASGFYVRQSYLKVCRSGWDIEEEKSRCYLRNGQVLVFKENGDFDILCGNGTKYIFYESAAVPRYEIISPTGEVWEVRTKGPCRYRKKLGGTHKIFIGTDPKTQETYYRREDGVNCMLWPNGRLVTNYPDGTKITSTPYFDEEITVEWTEEEKQYFLELESKHRVEVPELRSRTILRNSSAPKMSGSTTFLVQAFISVSCSYLIEHPKYSTVFFNPEEPYVTLTMPQKMKVLLYQEGKYVVLQEKHSVAVQGSTAEFALTCDDCDNRSTAVIKLDGSRVLCKVVDFFRKVFLVRRNGKATYYDSIQEYEENDDDGGSYNEQEIFPTTVPQKCLNNHAKKQGNNQRCFVVNRDLSGIEFIHADKLAYDCYKLPDETYFDLHTESPPNISHTFSTPYHRVGYEDWVMDYEEKDNSLPTNLKKRDLKEFGVKDNQCNLFKYPFPKHHNRESQQPAKPDKQINMPKVMVARIVKCLGPDPNTLIQHMQKYITAYQKRAHDVSNAFLEYRSWEKKTKNQEQVEMRLKKIALTLNQSLSMYPHLCTKFPSTEKDIHYFGHFIQLMEEFKGHTWDKRDVIPDCKQLPKPVPRLRIFPTIPEESGFN